MSSPSLFFIHRLSLRFRLIALFVLIFGATMILFSALVFRNSWRTHQTEFDAALYNHAVDVSQAINFDFFGDLSVHANVLSESEKVFPFALGKSFLQIRSLDGSVLVRSVSLGTHQLPMTQDEFREANAQGVSFRSLPAKKILKNSNLHGPESFRVITYLIRRDPSYRLILQIAVPMTFLEKERANLLTFFYLTIPILLLGSGLAGWFISQRALAPVRTIIDKAKAIQPGQLNDRIPLPAAADEIHELAGTLNALLDRLQNAFESQERFVADASHQLKTPLSILRGELDLIRRVPRTQQEIEEFLSSASQEVDYLSQMVQDLLLLARVDAGVASLAMIQIRLDEIVLEAVSRLEKLAKTKGVSIRVNLREADDYETLGDSELLYCMIQNLIENAIKHSPLNGVIEVSLGKESAGPAPRWRVDVRDQGAGIPEELQPKIFERFFQVKQSGNPKPSQGVGLGLPIAKRIAEAHGGTIQIKSLEGIGSVFTATIGQSQANK